MEKHKTSKGITCDECEGVTYYAKTLDRSFRGKVTKSGSEEQELHESPKKEKHRKTSENIRVHKTSPKYKRQGNE